MPYDPAHKPGVLQLLGYLWDDLDADGRQERYEWRYEQNPHGKRQAQFVAVEGDQVVGFRTFTLQHFQIRRQSCIAASPSDAIVQPEARGQGVFTALNKVALEAIEEWGQVDLYLNLSSNMYSTPASARHAR